MRVRQLADSVGERHVSVCVFSNTFCQTGFKGARGGAAAARPRGKTLIYIHCQTADCICKK